eukprot:TRINITY_DN9572_c0_g1_i1.p1 TRINITY_DN9572_c0_g1~~TRINITY_DN9572_c0_g1_i1.p1  ORF type:complete len:488 (-),score=94.96 TRINITY_DN9572_c0_g1_i1:5-1468(-)
MSGTEDLDSVYKCLRAGADDYLLKPIQVNAVKNLWKNVFRKRQESKFLGQLSDERSKRTQMDEEMQGLKEEIASLKSQFSEAVDTPINVITRTIGEISKKDNLNDDVRKALSVIVKSLGSSNLYRPAFSKLLERGTDVDPLTRRYLATELKYDQDGDEKTVSWPSVKPSSEGREQLRSWEFDVWSHSADELLPLLEDMFNDFGLLEKFQIAPEKFRTFLLSVRDNYNSKNPYHNFRHAFDVTQAAYIFLTRAKAAEFMTHLEILALLIGSLGHDLNHPGLNNAYQICTGSSLAIRYNDRGVLENFHASSLFEIMKAPGTDILSAMTEVDYKDFRKLTINLILATDLACHMEHTTKFQTISENFTRENKDHREMLLSMVIKASDISNPARPGPVARYWSELVQEEFFQQGDVERQKGLKISPFMDREDPNLPKMSVGFIDFFVRPLFSQLQKVLPESDECLLRVADTRNGWVEALEAQIKVLEQSAAG